VLIRMARQLGSIYCIQHPSTMNYSPRFDQIDRDEFIKLLGGAAAAW
jgi:hypothetical protein